MSTIEEKTTNIWCEIDTLHLKYLQHEDNVAKVRLMFSGEGSNAYYAYLSHRIIDCFPLILKFNI